jgi:hypothetical protein
MKYRRFTGVGAGLLLSLVVASTALAVDPPTPGTPPADHPTITNLETLPPATRVALGVKPAYLFGHTDYSITINRRYNGYIQSNLQRGCLGPCTMSMGETETWNNQLSFSVGFERGPINAKVGFDTSRGGSQWFSYSFPVPSGIRQVIYKEEWYDTFILSGAKRNCDILGNCDPWTYGSGWAGSWLYRIFKAVTV